jgi:hypothetical protein
VGRAGVEHVADLQRRRLVGVLDRIVLALHIASAEFPGELQLADVAGRDLSQRRIAVAVAAAAIRRPVCARRSLRLNRRRRFEIELTDLVVRIANERRAHDNQRQRDDNPERRRSACARVGAKAPAANKINNQIATGTSTSPRGASDQKSSPTSHSAQPSVPSNSAAKSHNASPRRAKTSPAVISKRGAGDPVVGRPADGAEPDAAEEEIEPEERQHSGRRGDDDSSAESVRHDP